MELKTMMLRKKGATAWVYFNRPQRLNSFTLESLDDMKKIIGNLKKDRGIKSVVIMGKGKSFSTGIDLREMGKVSLKKAKEFVRGSAKAMLEFQKLDKVIVAAVNGYALGGGAEFLLLADYRIASKDAKIGFPEIGLGYTVSSSIFRLVKDVGELKAKELLFTGKHISAKEALKIGLVNEVVSGRDLEKSVGKFVNKINKTPNRPIKGMKRLMDKYSLRKLETAINDELKLFDECFSR